MSEISNILGRMRELAVQSASDGVNADDRANIDLEFQQLKAEITRIGDSTEYNNMKLIDGSRAKFLTPEFEGGNGSSVDLTASTAIGDGKISSIHNTSDQPKIASSVANGTYKFDDPLGDGTTLSILDSSDSILQTVTKASGFAAGDVVNFDKVGIVINLDNDGTGSDYVKGNLNELTLEVHDGTFTTIQVGSNNDSSIPPHSTIATENRITINIANTTSEGLGISRTNLGSLGDAQSAINYLDSAIAKLSDERSNIGSLQNRLEFTSSNLMNSVQNSAASMSTIRDADFAAEAADLAKNQILIQSGTAMLAQANGLSQNVLALIR